MLFNEITRDAVREAFEHPKEIDAHLVDAQQARRILDRLVGYQVSPLLWDKVKRGISAGRVQTVALRLIVEREREIQAFQKKEYWTITANVEGKKPPVFEARLAKYQGKDIEIPDQATADRITAAIKAAQPGRAVGHHQREAEIPGAALHHQQAAAGSRAQAALLRQENHDGGAAPL